MSHRQSSERLHQLISEILRETQLYHKAIQDNESWDVKGDILDRLEELRNELTNLRQRIQRDGENPD
jgi:uncharacterized protein YceH (UPF0502 family)